MVMHSGLTVLPALTAAEIAAARRETIFTCCKWDPQVEDTATLSDFALSLSPQCWFELTTKAEALYRETLCAEAEIARNPRLIRMLGLLAPLESVLIANQHRQPPAAPLRVMRFDFHPTAEGWRISEVNSDVPGGYIEASGYSSIMARHYAGHTLTTDPVQILIGALRRHGLGDGTIGLVHATAYTDDRQVMIFLQRKLQQARIASQLVSPSDLNWKSGFPSIDQQPLSALLRFFPIEWLPNLPGNQWKAFFNQPALAHINSGLAALSQSKRFPLTWPHLDTPLPTWRALLPETRPWQSDFGPEWICKPAFGRVGDGIGLAGVTTEREWTIIRKGMAKRPAVWIAQRRFNALSFETHHGAAYPCLGVYVIDGYAAGIYGRIARRPIIDHLAQDIAVLIPATTPPSHLSPTSA